MRMTPLLYASALVLVGGCGRTRDTASEPVRVVPAQSSFARIAAGWVAATTETTARAAALAPVALPVAPEPSMRSSSYVPAEASVTAAPMVRPWFPLGARSRRPDPSPKDPSIGAPDAPVTAVVFGDHQCPYTGRALGTVLELQRDVGEAQLRVVWKSLPLSFHRRSRAAAMAGQAVHVAAGGAAFFSFSRALMTGEVRLDDTTLEEKAVASGAPRSVYRSLLAETAMDLGAKVDADTEVAASLGIHGVPYVFMNDREIDGAAPKADFAAAFDDALSSPVCSGPT